MKKSDRQEGEKETFKYIREFFVLKNKEPKYVIRKIVGDLFKKNFVHSTF
jgi:hypothetical protein